jgi:hypothetical protein
MARPRKEIDAEGVRKLAALGCTNAEIGAWFKVDEGTIRNRFSEEVALGRENGKTSLRRLQWKAATGGSVPMLIHLGKHYLGQFDRPAPSSDPPDERPHSEDGREIDA